MTATLDRIVHPDVNYSVETGHRKIGLGIGLVALMILAIVKATAIADGDAALAASLNNYGIAAMFFGFTMVLTGISFAIALGLGTIIYVIRFQSIRIREIAQTT